jgi:hypothetical protein
MSNLTFSQAQADMRKSYRNGASGVLVSALVWLSAGAVALMISPKASIWTLLIGGAAIYPLSVLVEKLLGNSGKHAADNPLGKLAMEGTFWMLAGIAVAYGVHLLRIEWFFPVMMLVIGGRYLTFQTLYGLRIYWVMGALLCAAGLTCALTKVPVHFSAFAGGVIEIVFAVLLFKQAKLEFKA